MKRVNILLISVISLLAFVCGCGGNESNESLSQCPAVPQGTQCRVSCYAGSQAILQKNPLFPSYDTPNCAPMVAVWVPTTEKAWSVPYYFCGFSGCVMVSPGKVYLPRETICNLRG